jgi:hypothetical protein
MNEEWIEMIDKYFNGEMSNEERVLFEEELARNSELSSTFRIYQAIEEVIGGEEKNKQQKADLKNTLESIGKEYFSGRQSSYSDTLGSSSSSSRFRGETEQKEESIRHEGQAKVVAVTFWLRFAVAVILIGIIVLSAVYMLRKDQSNRELALNKKEATRINSNSFPNRVSTTSDTSAKKLNIPPGVIPPEVIPGTIPIEEEIEKKRELAGSLKIEKQQKQKNFTEALFAENFKPDAAPQHQEDPLRDAFNHYENREYREAIKALENVDVEPVSRGEGGEEKQEQLTFYTSYYKGLSYLTLGNTQKAILELKNAKSSDLYWQSKARWYLALAYFRANQRPKAVALLQRVAGDENAKEYKNKAQHLFNQVKE